MLQQKYDFETCATLCSSVASFERNLVSGSCFPLRHAVLTVEIIKRLKTRVVRSCCCLGTVVSGSIGSVSLVIAARGLIADRQAVGLLPKLTPYHISMLLY